MILAVTGRLGARLAAAVILAVLVAQIAVSPALHVNAGNDVEGFTVEARVPVPAVSAGGDSSRLIEIVVEVSYPGRGEVEVSAGGEVDDTTRYSMMMAVYTAAVLAGYNPWSIDARVEVRSFGPVAGPSGSLAVALAVAYLLMYREDVDFKEYGVAVTGAISPDTLAASVGGVPVKCIAANREGLSLVIPLTNLPDLEGESACVYEAIAGLIDGLGILGVPRIMGDLRVELPPEFADAMKSVAEAMREEARRILKSTEALAESGYIDSGRLEEVKASASERLEESSNVEEISEYAAASIAFGGVIQAYTGYYEALIASGISVESIISSIESELQSVGAELDSMSREGSLLYVELLSVAYTRLASAEASLQEVKSLAGARNPQDLASQLAYAKARVLSIKGWVEAARSVQGAGPAIPSESLQVAVNMYRGYVALAVEYSVALADYLIDNFDLPWEQDLVAYRSSISYVLRLAESYFESGNYVAALGFYREALSRSLSLVFAGGVRATGEEIASKYYEALRSVFTILASRAYSKGYVSGLAEAYRQYSEYLYSRQSYNAAVEIMEEAVSAIMPWVLAAQSQLALQAPLQPFTALGGSAQDAEGGTFTSGAIVILVAASFSAALALGFYLSSRMYARALRSWG